MSKEARERPPEPGSITIQPNDAELEFGLTDLVQRWRDTP